MISIWKLGLLVSSLVSLVALAAENVETGATAPVGRLGSPMEVAPGTNSPATINGVDYSAHADSELDDVPTPDKYDHYTKAFLDERLQKIESYRPAIVGEAKALQEKVRAVG